MTDLWSEIIQNARAEAEPKRPTEMSLEEFMEKTGFETTHTARKYLDGLVSDGKMRKRLFGKYMLYEPIG